LFTNNAKTIITQNGQQQARDLKALSHNKTRGLVTLGPIISAFGGNLFRFQFQENQWQNQKTATTRVALTQIKLLRKLYRIERARKPIMCQNTNGKTYIKTGFKCGAQKIQATKKYQLEFQASGSTAKWQHWKMHWKSSNYRRTPLVIETYLYF